MLNAASMCMSQGQKYSKASLFTAKVTGPRYQRAMSRVQSCEKEASDVFLRVSFLPFYGENEECMPREQPNIRLQM